MSQSKTANRLGQFTVTPDGPIVAGSYGQWVFRYVVGEMGVDEGGRIVLNQKFPTDWQRPQFERPGDEGYTTVVTDGRAKFDVRYDERGGIRPWFLSILIDVKDYHLNPGEVVTITLGDRSGGSKGIRAQSFAESAHVFRLLVDPTNAMDPRPVGDGIAVPIVADETAKLVCHLPMQTVPGEEVKIFVRGEDKWGNPTAAPAGVEYDWRGGGEVTIEGDMLRFMRPGVGYVTAWHDQWSCRSNPIVCSESEPEIKRFYGDLHGQTKATVGTGTEQEYFAFGRDQACLDFISHQGNDFQVTEEDWRRLNEVVKEFHQDGEYVVFSGFEWSGNSCGGGDRNVFYMDENQPIFRHSHWLVPEVAEDEKSPAYPADELFAKIRKHVDMDKVVLGAHVGGRFADVRKYFDAELGPLVEIVSCWGVFEWLLWDAIEAGHIVGVMCNSDGHHGRPGCEGPGAGEFGIQGGLTCVLAVAKTREAIFKALRQRRCYGTTGARMHLDFEIGGRMMGSVIDCEAGKRYGLKAKVVGCGPVEKLEIYRGREVVKVEQANEFAECDDSNRVRISWKGSRIRGRARRVKWDGVIEVEGAKITAVAEHCIDTPTNGIVRQTDTMVEFVSQTTGDVDGIDLVVDDASKARILIKSEVTQQTIELRELVGEERRRVFDCGGLDMELVIERYPMVVMGQELAVEMEVDAGEGVTPYMVKATQVDGQMAWSSPIYLRG